MVLAAPILTLMLSHINTVNTGVRMDFPSVDTKSRDHLCVHTTAAECDCKAFHTVTVGCWLKGDLPRVRLKSQSHISYKIFKRTIKPDFSFQQPSAWRACTSAGHTKARVKHAFSRRWWFISCFWEQNMILSVSCICWLGAAWHELCCCGRYVCISTRVLLGSLVNHFLLLSLTGSKLPLHGTSSMAEFESPPPKPPIVSACLGLQ